MDLAPQDLGKKIQGISFEVRNSYGVNAVMYDALEGSVLFDQTLPSQSSWSRSEKQVLDMFQFPAAYVSGRRIFLEERLGILWPQAIQLPGYR